METLKSLTVIEPTLAEVIKGFYFSLRTIKMKTKSQHLDLESMQYTFIFRTSGIFSTEKNNHICFNPIKEQL